MEDQIKNARLSFTCNQDWEGMRPDADGRFCSSCQKKVYDLRNKNTAYFIKIMQENNNGICGRFRLEQMAQPKSANSNTWKGWLIAGLAILGLNSCKPKKSASEILGKSAVVVKEAETDSSDVLGLVLPVDSLQLKLPPSLNGN